MTPSGKVIPIQPERALMIDLGVAFHLPAPQGKPHHCRKLGVVQSPVLPDSPGKSPE